MILLQALLLSFGLFMVYVVHIHFRKKQLSRLEYALWLIIWMCFIAASFWPSLLSGVAQRLHIARVFDLLVLVALMIIMILSFHNRLAYTQLRQKVERMVRERALEAPTKEE